MFLPGHVGAMTCTLLKEHQRPASPSLGSPQPPAPQQPKPLKFGMDRILAADDPPRRRSPDHDEYTLSSLDVHSLSPGGRCCGGCELGGSRVPCSDCVSSLLRCCSVSGAATLAAPTPTYPYAPLHYLPLHHNAAHYASLYGGSELLHQAPAKPSGASPSSAASSGNSGQAPGASGGGNKRKRSWSRAVFSNLQRKGLEKRFQLQKYITKPDRRQLAATLGLTDAQVKVWFQNRRMKWRHSKEAKLGVAPGVVDGAPVTTSLLAARPGVAAEVRPDDLDRRAADSTQLECADLSSDEDSDVDIEVTS